MVTVMNGAETRSRREQTGLWWLASLQAVGAKAVVTLATAEVRPLFKPRSSLQEGWVKFTGRKRATGTLKTERRLGGDKFTSIPVIVCCLPWMPTTKAAERRFDPAWEDLRSVSKHFGSLVPREPSGSPAIQTLQSKFWIEKNWILTADL